MFSNKRPVHELKRRLFSRYFMMPPSGISSVVLLAGVSRSGTTWVADIINCRNDYRVVFEPFHRSSMQKLAREPFLDLFTASHQAAGPSMEYVGEVFSGKTKHPMIDAHNRCFCSSRLLIKEVTCMVNLHHILEYYPQTKLVYLLRHPLAVAASKISLGWKPHLDVYRSQEPLMNLLPQTLVEAFDELHDDVSLHIATWVVENFTALRLCQPAQYHAVSYELIKEQTEEQVEQLFTFLGEKVPVQLERCIRRPSSTARSTQIPGVEAWKGTISEAHVKLADTLLSASGLDMFYMADGPRPVSDPNKVKQEFYQAANESEAGSRIN